MAGRPLGALLSLALLPLVAACGGPGTVSVGGDTGAAAAGVEVSGEVSAAGTKGSILVFAFAGGAMIAGALGDGSEDGTDAPSATRTSTPASTLTAGVVVNTPTPNLTPSATLPPAATVTGTPTAAGATPTPGLT